MSKAIALDAAWIFAAFLVVLVGAAIGLAIRRMLLDRHGGTVECGLRRPGGTWRLGVAAYEEDELRWYGAVVDCHDARALSRWWAEVLGWQVAAEDDDGIVTWTW